MRILGRTSSINVRKVLWTATEIGLKFDHEHSWGKSPEDIKTTTFLNLNPNGLVPVWEDDMGVLWESNTICRYLASRHSRQDLLPIQPFARASVEKWMDWQASDLNSAWRYAFMALIRQHDGYSDKRQVDRSASTWNALMQILENRLIETKAYVAGLDFTLADIVIGLSVHRWRLTPIDHIHTPAVDRYVQRLSNRPAFVRLAAPDLP